jgi:hypothetical protein
MAADALSRPLGDNQGKDNNEAMIMILDSAFIRVMDEDSPESLKECIAHSQCKYQPILKAWEACTPLLCSETIDKPTWKTKDTLKLAIPPDLHLFCEINTIGQESANR